MINASEIENMIAKDHDLFLIHDHRNGHHIIAIINDEDEENRFVVDAVDFDPDKLREFRDAINKALAE